MAMFNFAPRTRGQTCTPRGYRAYAVGDVHGRLDLLDRMLTQIQSDLAGRDKRKTILVFLGDLIDRGPDSAGVIERLRSLSIAGVSCLVLAGNHEEVLLRILKGERGILNSWLRFGGSECLQSYGIDPEWVRHQREGDALRAIRKAIPVEHAEFLSGFADSVRFGDYLFVHAGIRPDVDLSLQLQQDLRWIRQAFLEDERDHGFVVVHGHTISEQVVERPNRIGIDTGAYRSGKLTALGLEDEKRWYLTAEQASPAPEGAH